MSEPTRVALLEQVAALGRTVEALTARVAELTAENAALREQLALAQKEAARQAAPFRRPDAHKVPPARRKKSGRPAGHPGVNRPVPAHVDATVTVPLAGCPRCQGPVAGCRDRVQYVEDLPPVRPHVTKLTTQSGTCPACGPVESTHPLQTGRGVHASQVHVGPRALALAAALNKHHGLSMRKTCRVLFDVGGLTLSAGGLSQALDRMADRMEADYQRLFADVRAGPAAYVDETSWWVGGPGHWLWAFATVTTTLYQVRESRGSAVVTDVLTPEYAGVLVSDCLNIYDAGIPYDRKHKCIAHHQKAIRAQLDSPGLGDRAYLEGWKGLFETVCEITRERELLGEPTFTHLRARCEAKRDALLAEDVTQPADVRIRHRLAKQAPYLLTCLHDPAVEATNNRAERALRPAVIARKVSCGNKTARGKRTFERLASLVTTWWQRGKDVVGELARRCSLQRSPPVG